ncbi:ThiF family adenylyltransferase [Pseudoduganella ginsengisoli]|nr:ThiF family adenylyltransferase [Pseudoduganella ginsengisoli]
MLADLISRNPDLQRLMDDGYSVEIRRQTGLHLLVHDVPYRNAPGDLKRGTLVCPIHLREDNLTNAAANHQAWFIGEHPCSIEGTPIAGIVHSSGRSDFGDGIVVDHGFSTKPRTGFYNDYYDKMTHYINVISAPAQHLDPTLTARLYKPAQTTDNSVFYYADTASTRSGIGSIAGKVAALRIAIVGLGGTGSHILDLVAKTHVNEIHLFDGDAFYSHNAFRAPSATAISDLQTPELKAKRYARIYSVMRRGVEAHPEYVTDQNVGLLQHFDFVFICIDKGAARELIAKYLLQAGIPFIDVGMHVQMTKDAQKLVGQVRTTFFSPKKNDHFDRRVPVDSGNMRNDYGLNIQVNELNALNAVHAVIRWKKYYGIYDDQIGEHESVYAINAHMLTKDERVEG